MKEKIRKLVEDNTTRKGDFFDCFIQFSILASLLTFRIETFPNNPKATLVFLNTFVTTCVSIFTLECILRIDVSKNPFNYSFNFYAANRFNGNYPNLS